MTIDGNEAAAEEFNKWNAAENNTDRNKKPETASSNCNGEKQPEYNGNVLQEEEAAECLNAHIYGKAAENQPEGNGIVLHEEEAAECLNAHIYGNGVNQLEANVNILTEEEKAVENLKSLMLKDDENKIQEKMKKEVEGKVEHRKAVLDVQGVSRTFYDEAELQAAERSLYNSRTDGEDNTATFYASYESDDEDDMQAVEETGLGSVIDREDENQIQQKMKQEVEGKFGRRKAVLQVEGVSHTFYDEVELQTAERKLYNSLIDGEGDTATFYASYESDDEVDMQAVEKIRLQSLLDREELRRNHEARVNTEAGEGCSGVLHERDGTIELHELDATHNKLSSTVRLEKTDLAPHVDSQIRETSFKCNEQRGIMLQQMDQLNRYPDNHSGMKRFICDICKKSFSLKGSLKRHMVRIHSEMPNFACRMCHRKFQEKCTLDRHMHTHSDKKYYYCKYCTYGSSKPYNLKRHGEQCHPEHSTK